MNKPTSTALYSLLVMLIFFGLSFSIQSCGEKKQDPSLTEETSDEFEEDSENYTEDEFFEEDGAESNEATTEDYTSSNEAESDSPSDSYSSTSSSSDSYSASSYTKPYMIVAGNYLLEGNADKMVRDLRNKGYNGAEKVVFDISQYHTVIAGRYDSQSEASNASNQLKQSGVDCYVIKKK